MAVLLREHVGRRGTGSSGRARHKRRGPPERVGLDRLRACLSAVRLRGGNGVQFLPRVRRPSARSAFAYLAHVQGARRHRRHEPGEL